MRLALLAERLRQPWDEGIKNVAVHLIEALAAQHEVLALTTEGADDAGLDITNVSANRLLWSDELRQRLRTFVPQAVVYIPTACATVFSLARARVLHQHTRGAPVALVALQPRRYSYWQKLLAPRLASDCVLAQSARTAAALRHLGNTVALLPPAVDSTRFCPATRDEKAALRKRYGIPQADQVLLHVGHLKSKRNVRMLQSLVARPGWHAVIVGSTSTMQDEALKQELSGPRVTIVDTYVERIEELYRLADLYLFLAVDPTAAIDMPLSVLEAMACNLAVVSTPYGGLPDFFPAQNGLFYVQDLDRLSDAVTAALDRSAATRSMVEHYTWPAAAHFIVQQLLGTGLTSQ